MYTAIGTFEALVIFSPMVPQSQKVYAKIDDQKWGLCQGALLTSCCRIIAKAMNYLASIRLRNKSLRLTQIVVHEVDSIFFN